MELTQKNTEITQKTNDQTVDAAKGGNNCYFWRY